MSNIGLPGLAMLLVLANIALCLGVDRARYVADERRPAVATFTAMPLSGTGHANRQVQPETSSAARQIPSR